MHKSQIGANKMELISLENPVQFENRLSQQN